MKFANTESDIKWGVDSFGVKHYLCDYCELVFGTVDPDTIIHKCDETKPKYHNRDKQQNSERIKK